MKRRSGYVRCWDVRLPLRSGIPQKRDVCRSHRAGRAILRPRVHTCAKPRGRIRTLFDVRFFAGSCESISIRTVGERTSPTVAVPDEHHGSHLRRAGATSTCRASASPAPFRKLPAYVCLNRTVRHVCGYRDLSPNCNSHCAPWWNSRSHFAMMILLPAHTDNRAHCLHYIGRRDKGRSALQVKSTSADVCQARSRGRISETGV